MDEPDLDQIDVWARKIAHQMRYRNEEGAIRMVKHGIRAIHDPSNTSVLDTPMAHLVNMRSANVLEDNGILTIGDFLSNTVDELRAIRNFGDPSIIKCLQSLLQHMITRVLDLEENGVGSKPNLDMAPVVHDSFSNLF